MMRQDRFTEQALEVVRGSQRLVRELRQSQWDVEHVFLAIAELPEGAARELLQELGVSAPAVVARLRSHLARSPKLGFEAVQISTTPRVVGLLDAASREADRLRDQFVGVEHLLLAVADVRDGESAAVLAEYGVTKERVYAALQKVRGSARVDSPTADAQYRALTRYTTDLTRLAADGELDPVIGRDGEVERLMQVLNRRTKNNPVLIGEAGVGKTAIVEGLAQRLAAGGAPERLRDKRVLALDMGALVAGSKFRGEFEERLQSVMREVREADGAIVLFLDEIHQVVGAGGADGAIDASNMMKPALARGELRVIGATTLDEYRRIEADPALERRFSPVYVDEPSPEDAERILAGLRPRYEQHHGIAISDAALAAAVRLGVRYLGERRLPDKAIDLIDEAASRHAILAGAPPDEVRDLRRRLDDASARLDGAAAREDYEEAARVKQEVLRIQDEHREREARWREAQGVPGEVGEEGIAALVAQMTGIPAERMLEGESARLLRMEEALHRRVVGQDRAIAVLADAIRRARSGLKDPRRPIGSFVFLGPTGVGKTELAKALAEYLFDDADALLRLDMSEYQERHTVSRLVGAPPGYVGYDDAGGLTEAVRRRPYRVVLFDEIEKAHPDVFNALLQILEDGRLTDAHGRTADFRNTVLILTSNLGEGGKAGAMGFARTGGEREREARRSAAEEALRGAFRPEFVNRLDEIVVFEALTEAEIAQVADLLLAEVGERLAERGVGVRVTEEAKAALAREGFDPAFGARPLRRTIQRRVGNELARRLLAGEFAEGDTAVVGLGADGEYAFAAEPAREVAAV